MRRFPEDLHSPHKELRGLTGEQERRLLRAVADGMPRRHLKRRFGISEMELPRVLSKGGGDA